MRELERIDRICDMLKEKWKEHPQQRLGQFLINYVFGRVPMKWRDDPDRPYLSSGEHWYWIKEDDITEKRLENIKALDQT